jgi:PAS domain S-box-containing protein
VEGKRAIVAERLKLRGKLTVLFLVLSLIPLSAISYVTYREGEQRVRDNITSHLKSIAEKDGELVTSFLAERQADLKVLSEAAVLDGRTEAQNLSAIMRAMRREYKVYQRIFITDLKGAVVATDGDETDWHQNEDISSSEWFKEASKGRDYISDVFLSGYDKRPLIIMSTPIKDPAGSAQGVAAARIDFSHVSRILQTTELGKTGEVYLINRAGYFLTHSRLGGNVLEARIPTGQEHIYLGESGISQHTDYRGKSVLSALHWLPDRKWMLVAEQDADEAFTNIHSFRVISIIVVAAVALAVIAVTFFVSDRIEGYLKKSYQKVLNLKKYSEDIIDSVPVSVLVLDRDQHIIQANRDFHLRFGMSEDDVKDKILADIIPDKILDDSIREVVDHSRPMDSFEISTDLGNAGNKILSVKAVPAHLEGTMHILLTIVDVTDKRIMEEQMLHAEKLRSMGILTAGVAHELNTPLANILLNTQMLIEEQRSKDAEYVETLRLIESQAKQGSSIVRGLLEFSRQSELAAEVADVNEILEDLLVIMDNQLRVSNIALVKVFDRDIPKIRTDIGKLQQVFMNLISNAVWAMSKGGELEIRTAFDGHAKRLTVAFSDTGCGIPKENLGKIFDPFFTTKEAGQGTGLGLAVSYGILRGMEGDIEVKSSIADHGSGERGGTTFTVGLPVSDSERSRS